ncbi:hypothetical protein ACJRO7_028014 [Eucalyptus globulus]|uniref:Uncharacterized protein n=1 Tax=Eucalyptus globulus TaxID=34317 RepID=A0ABD3K065_EUCGL
MGPAVPAGACPGSPAEMLFCTSEARIGPARAGAPAVKVKGTDGFEPSDRSNGVPSGRGAPPSILHPGAGERRPGPVAPLTENGRGGDGGGGRRNAKARTGRAK